MSEENQTPLKESAWKRTFAWCRRYISIFGILVIAFLCYMLFFQENSVFKYMDYQRQIDSLQVEIKNATDTMTYYRNLNERLSNDPETMEKIVRENYNMVREGEDVYVFE